MNLTGETLMKLIKKTSANFPSQQNVNVGEVGKLWMECFGNKPDDLMETALNLTLMNVRFWPTIRDIQESISELTAEFYRSSNKQLGYEPRSRFMSPAAKKALDAVKNGKIKEYLDQIDISDLKEYVRSRFPDMSDSLIRQNYGELSFAAESAGKCEVCMWTSGDCETGGYYPVPYLEKGGYVRLECAPCRKKRKV